MYEDHHASYSYNDEHNVPGSQSSPLNFQLPPILIANFPSVPAPPHPTDLLRPFATGSTSELFRSIVKKPASISLEINGELHSNAADVALQFAAELRVYRKVGKHSGFPAFLGAVEGLGLVIEWIDGLTLLEVLRGPSPPSSETLHKPPSKKRRITWYNQLVDALVHLHSFGLNHGDLSLLNVHVDQRTDAIKIIDFGRSISIRGYPCQDLYIEAVEPIRETKRRDPTPPPVFTPGGAWVDSVAALGRDSRPKLFDRSSRSYASSPAIPDSPYSVPRPVNHASRLLNSTPPLHHHSSSGSGYHTHMPVSMSRGNREKEMHPPSRPSSSQYYSPVSPTSASSDTYMQEDYSDDWTEIDGFHNRGRGRSHRPGEEYRHSHREDHREGHRLSREERFREDHQQYYSPPRSRQQSRSRSRPPPTPVAALLPPPKPEAMQQGSRPFCAPEVLRNQCTDPILADAYSLGIMLVCMDLCMLVDCDAWKQRKEDGSFPDLSQTTIFTDIIRGYVATAEFRERITLKRKMDVPENEMTDD